MFTDRLRIEWNEEKNLSNQRKHRLSFEEAAQVFRDPLSVCVEDRIVDGEARFQTIGIIGDAVVIVVAHADRSNEHEDVIRIISARAATRQEKRRYEEERN